MTSNITRSDRGIFSTESTGGVEDAVKKQLLHSPNSHTPTSTKNNSNGSNTNSLPSPPLKKKRSLPGNPDPSADVIALSPNTLITTNRFICEICNKGFQREQNLQLHRRGHNLPWKLKQKTTSEVRKRVYICPEPSCVHHNPARALGDLTGIKKHFSRKHGEKKWKCEKCCKKYAVLSDWKAHSKTCGTKEYKCDCGTIFSRKESFVAHRAFCDAISEKNNKLNKREYFSKKMGSNLQAQPIPNPNNTPSHAFELSQNSLNMLGQYNGLHPAEGPPQMSATALLQKVSQIGTTVTENNEFVTGLAPPSYGIMNGFTSSQECDFDANGTMSRLDMFNAILDQSKALSKIIEENNNTNSVIDIGGSKGSEDVMTLDFLGIGGGGGGTCGNLLENVGSDGIWRNWSNENLGFESFSATTSM